jgi:hypothetical protein
MKTFGMRKARIAYAYCGAAEQDFVRLAVLYVRKCHRRAIKT